MTDLDARRVVIELLDEYELQKKEKGYTNTEICTRIIDIYYKYVKKPEFKLMVDDLKKNFMFNEARVEQNKGLEEELGLSAVYDYIADFDFDKNNFNVFTNSLLLNQKLYSRCPNPEFGGTMRDSSVMLYDLNKDVMSASEAKQYLNSYIAKTNEVFRPLEECGIFEYIENCVVIVTDLIKAQPFTDGNKRTFRGLFNLMMKKIKIPPLYIRIEERDAYKKALEKAIVHDDYDEMIGFYYFKICDAIANLDVKKSYISDEQLNCEKVNQKYY